MKPGGTDQRHKDSNTLTIANIPVCSPVGVELKTATEGHLAAPIARNSILNLL